MLRTWHEGHRSFREPLELNLVITTLIDVMINGGSFPIERNGQRKFNKDTVKKIDTSIYIDLWAFSKYSQLLPWYCYKKRRV